MLHSGGEAGSGHGDRGNGERRLGEILVEAGDLSPEQLAAALDRQQSLGERHRYYLLGRVLISLGYANAHRVNAALAQQELPGPAAEMDAAPAPTEAERQAGRDSEPWQVPTNAGPVRPTSALGVLDGLAEKIAAGDMETMSPLPLGFDPLDEALGGGIRPGELILLGGGQGVGKTTMAFQMARNVAASGEATCLYLCFEHDEENLAQRLIAMESVDPESQEFRLGVTVRDLTQRIMAAHRRGDVALYDLLEADPKSAAALERVRRYGDRLHLLKGGARATLAAVAALVEAHRVRSDERLVLFVDYLQKVPVLPEPRTEQERVEIVVSGLKELAMAQQIPVVAVVASDREGLRAKRMRAHHILGGSLLAYEADVILMLADKFDAVARVHIEFNPQKAQALHDWIVCSVEKNRSGRDVVDMEFEKLFSYCCLNPNGGYVTEKLVDERVYLE
jgi:replicative DNA helicase